jgi:low affinity Fe/Cu permease
MAENLKGRTMTVEWWIDVVLIALISITVVQNMGLRDRLKDIEAKLDRQK